MKKDIWIYWAQGWSDAPEICKVCLESWRRLNPGWRVHRLDRRSCGEYIPPEALGLIEEFGGRWPEMTRCELIRLFLVAEYGGLYTDATNLCNLPLDSWLGAERLVEGAWLHWDFDSRIPTFNFLYAAGPGNALYRRAFEAIAGDRRLRDGGYGRIYKAFSRLLPPRVAVEIKRDKQIGRSSNNGRRKQGVKIIANSFELMNSAVGPRFRSAVDVFPFFKLSWKFEGNDIPIKERFRPDSKLLFLLERRGLI